MVNTFIFTHSFRESAALMDNARLGKQRVEGKQILNNLITIRVLSSHLGLDVRTLGISQTVKSIKAWLDSHGQQIILDEFGNITDVQTSTGLTVKKLGYATHPCTAMWYGYEDALKDYINVHIDEWIARGCVNNMTKYTCASNYARPEWTMMPEVHNMFRCACLYKEAVRNEKPWYQLQPETVTAYMNARINKDDVGKNFTQYIWPSVLDDSWKTEMLHRYSIQ